MADNTRYMARVPIIPDDFENKDRHKENELVMDYNTNDIYAKKDDGYISITGKIKEEIKKIQDGSMVVHLVTEDSLPPIKDRPTNHWYFVITEAVDAGKGSTVVQSSYIYYGLVDSYSRDKNYILVAQNMIEGTDTVKMVVKEGYTPCFYVPISLGASFKNADTGELIEYTVQDRVYTLNNEIGSFVAYDVYLLDLTKEGEYFITIDVTGSEYFTITFDSNTSVAGLVLPDKIRVYDGDTIGDLLPNEPTKEDPRYDFKGWSTSKISFLPVDKTYKPESSMTLFAWYEYNDDPKVLTYYCNYISTTGVVIGTYCSTCQKDEIVSPVTFAGYTAPTSGVTVKTDGQQITFVYTPITYNISYNLDEGSFDAGDNPKREFTVEDSSYTPPTPSRVDHVFAGWSPITLLKGTTEDVTFTASWTDMPMLPTGNNFRTLINKYFGIETISTLATASSLIGDGTDYYNISTSSTPIYVWVKGGILWFYSKGDINVQTDMSNAFKGWTLLRDISILSTWKTKTNMTVDNLFNGCSLLADVSAVENWSNGVFKSFTDAFKGTIALEAGRTPSWYKWTVKINYRAYDEEYKMDKMIDTETITCIPNDTIYSKEIAGYTISGDKYITITDPSITYEFIYKPILYNIWYNNINGGQAAPEAVFISGYLGPSFEYTPPALEKEGATFGGWSPSSMPAGLTCDFTFNAIWK